MTSNSKDDEFVAVRVQDPRVQNEGSWNSYVDYKIFLHTNSKAFTAKTSCVRRRYSEFVWLRKKMQKNAGLVPVPDLPGKSFFSFSSEDFLERRRKGLQAFLEKVVHTTVCLSDSQLHLFLQTQLPIGHIQDCVQGHTPYSVTDAILTYASSNRGLAQAQEDDDAVKDSSLTVSYESMESPALHPPCPQTNEAFSPELLSCGDPDPLDGLLELRDQDPAESQQTAKSSVRISQSRNHLEAVVEGARFYLGESLDDTPGLEERIQHSGPRMQTPVVVHSPMGGGGEEGVDSVFEDESHEEARESGGRTSAQPDSREEVRREAFDGSIEILAFKDDACEEEVVVGDAAAGVPEGGDVCLERLVLENRMSGGEEAQTEEETLQSDVTVNEGTCDDDAAEETLEDLIGTEGESDEDSRSLPSSNGSIVKVSDEEEEEEEEEGACEEADLSIQAANGLVKLPPDVVRRWSEAEASGGGFLGLRVNGCTVDKRDEDEDVDVSSAVGDGDLTENSDISILESSSLPGLTDGRCLEREASPGLDAADLHPEAEVL